MKKFIAVCILVLLVPAFAFSQVSLDLALKNSTGYLNSRLPAGSKVVVLNCTSYWPLMSEYIIEELVGYIVNDGSLTVVDRANLESIRKELNFQLSGEVSDETAQSIGKMVGAQHIISGSITAIGSTYRLRIKTISVETAQIVGMLNSDVAQDSRSAALTGTAYAGTTTTTAPTATVAASTNTTASAKTTASKNAPANYLVFSDINWWVDTDAANETIRKNTTTNFNISREILEGQEKEVLTISVDLGKANDWRQGIFVITDQNEALMQIARRSTGVRFKVLGDGKRWMFQASIIESPELTNYYDISFATKKGKVTTVTVPYSKLKQQSWQQKQVKFDKNRISYMEFKRFSDPTYSGNHTESGPSTIKVFDMEIY